MQSIVGDIKSLFLQGGIVFGAQQFFNSIVQTGGEIVQQHVALRSILGDVQKADELFAQTQQLALQSPFKFGELNRDVKQLAAFGVEANDCMIPQSVSLISHLVLVCLSRDLDWLMVRLRPVLGLTVRNYASLLTLDFHSYRELRSFTIQKERTEGTIIPRQMSRR